MTTPSAELAIIPGVEANKLALITPESALAVKAAYLPHFTAFLALEKQASEIAVNSPKLARIMRLDLRKVRVAAEKARKDLGIEAKNYKEAVDQVYNLLENRLKPVEERMRGIEEAEERAEAERLAKVKEARLAELTPIALITTTSLDFYDLANLPEAQYVALKDSLKTSADAKLLAVKQAEEKRLAEEAAKEAERKRLAEENARLAIESAAKQKALDEANRKAEIERKKAAEEAQKLRQEAEAKLAAERKAAADKAAKERAEREAQERAAQAKRDEETRKQAIETAKKDAATKAECDRLATEALKAQQEVKRLADEAKAREEAEKAKKAREAEEARKAATAPDKERLFHFAQSIQAIQVPILTSPAGKVFNETLKSQVSKMVKWLESSAEKL